ncbi:MAG: putative collagen-binding domain-containing protein, partial [Thermoguttaceae bacterium]|nr:putative collagen-binding domain-containing protein [Thermoguttaceae bacterium]
KRTTWTDHLAGTPKLDRAWEPLRRAMGQTRRFAERMDLACVKPAGGLASTGYCLAHAAEKAAEYLIYAPQGGPLTVDLSATPGKLAVEWSNPTSGEAIAGRPVTGGAKRTLKAPFEGEAVVYLSTRGK